MTLPRATYRLQLHDEFTFAAARDVLPYLAALGVSHIYLSPILTARPGSMHGYDVVDPTRVNPELGGEDGLRQLVTTLRQHELGLIVDIVPNHMATDVRNPWWTDVLACGRQSHYAKYFDINWEPPNQELKNKVLMPVLGRPYGEALEAGEIRLTRNQSGVVVRYFGNEFPTAPDCDIGKIELFDPSTAVGRSQLHHFLEQQHYRLAWWRTANDTINWRRFFDINELVAMRIEDDEVFAATHDTIFRLYREGLIDGVRVDHIDGLASPGAYCRKLRACLRELEKHRPKGSPPGPAYFVVEKILARGEDLPRDWQTDGTTGYDFMNQVSALQHYAGGEPILSTFWHEISGRPASFYVEEQLARRQTLAGSFSAQLEALVASLTELANTELRTRDYAAAAIRRCLTDILTHFPVYRIYARIGCTSEADENFLRKAIRSAETTCLPGDRWLVPILGDWLGGKLIASELRGRQDAALARFQQLSAPLCAKAVEDTAFYRYGRLISRNDVGFDGAQFSLSVADFHRLMQERVGISKGAMLATATHDHKRGEDVRARLAVLSEVATSWCRAVDHWIETTESGRTLADGSLMPSTGDIAILFQTIVGAWPLELSLKDQAQLDAYAKRIKNWQQKALREAKLASSWATPNESYEDAAQKFVDHVFSDMSPILPELAAFADRIAPAGAINALGQTLLKLTVPGVPDIYQGTEYWDQSLVDPDNRSTVNFAVRTKSLGSCDLTKWRRGETKQTLIEHVFALRKKYPLLFSEGAYVPLEASGALEERLLCFARYLDNVSVIAVICRFNVGFEIDSRTLAVPSTARKYSHIHLPQELCGKYCDAISPNKTVALHTETSVAQLLGEWPVGLFVKAS